MILFAGKIAAIGMGNGRQMGAELIPLNGMCPY